MTSTDERGRRRARRNGLGTGTTSLLMIFTLLCLVTLAMLSLTTARSDRRIKQRGLVTAQEQMEAEGLAAADIATIDGLLFGLRDGFTGDEEAYLAAAEGLLHGAGYEAEEGSVWFTVPMGEDNELYTQLLILPPGEAARLRLAAQMSRSTLDWAPDDERAVWLPGQGG